MGAHPRPEPEISLQMVLNLTLVNLQFSNYAVVQKQQGLSRKHPANSERESPWASTTHRNTLLPCWAITDILISQSTTDHQVKQPTPCNVPVATL